MKKNLIFSYIFLLIIFFFNYYTFAKVENSNFKIIKKSHYSNGMQVIGEANFEKMPLFYKEEKVVYFKVTVRFQDLGVSVFESHEAIAYESDSKMIYTSFKNDKGKKLSARKEGTLVNLSIKSNSFFNNLKLEVPGEVIPSILLYLKLPTLIGKSSEYEYFAYNEDETTEGRFYERGKSVYKGVQEVEILEGKERLHLFINSFGEEKSIIYYDMKLELRAIQFMSLGQNIVFIRND